jgi:hypothetical protein
MTVDRLRFKRTTIAFRGDAVNPKVDPCKTHASGASAP